jgi:hypothetical protein
VLCVFLSFFFLIVTFFNIFDVFCVFFCSVGSPTVSFHHVHLFLLVMAGCIHDLPIHYGHVCVLASACH